MVSAEDLSVAALSEHLPGRAIRSYPALLSTAADAMAWARSGAPDGAVVVADYQASPRGRGGVEWRVRPGLDLAFSLVLRVDLPVEREGWLYTVATSGVAGLRGSDPAIEWPDQVRQGEERLADVGIEAGLAPGRVEFAVVSVMLPDAAAPRGRLLREAIESIDRACGEDPEALLQAYLSRCRTIGRRVLARMIPMGPNGPKVSGLATGAKLDGALVIETARGTHVAVRPQNLGVLEDEPDRTGPPSYPDAVLAYLERDRGHGSDPSRD